MHIKQKDTQFFIGYGVTTVIVLILVWLLVPGDVSRDTETVILVSSLAAVIFGGFIAVVIGIWIEHRAVSKIEGC